MASKKRNRKRSRARARPAKPQPQARAQAATASTPATEPADPGLRAQRILGLMRPKRQPTLKRRMILLAVVSALLVPVFFMNRLFGVNGGPAEVIGVGPLLLAWLLSCGWQVFIIARQTRTRGRSLAIAGGCVLVCIVSIEIANTAALIFLAGRCATAGACR